MDDVVAHGLVNNHNDEDEDDDAANLSTLLEITTAAASIEGVLGNTLHYTPHNFHQAIMIHYPTLAAAAASTGEGGGHCYNNIALSYNSHSSTYNDNIGNSDNNNNNNQAISLPVCAKCKKNYKTRDHCRIKYGHTAVPWTNSYICITIDESCIGMDGKYIVDDDAKLHAVVVSSSLVVPPPPPPNNTTKKTYVVQTCLDTNAPVCYSCKQSNRTKAYCRKKFRHKDLPWNTLYVMLKLQPNMMMMMMTGNFLDPFQDDVVSTMTSTTKVGKNDNVQEEEEEGGEQQQQQQHPPQQPQEQQQNQEKQQNEPTKELEEEFDINCIAPSRTFLSIISSDENSIRWLKCVETTRDNDDDNSNNDYDERSLKQPPLPQQQQDIDFMSSNPYYHPRWNGGPILQHDTFQSSLHESATVKRKRKTKTKKVTASTTNAKSSSSSSSSLSKKKSKKSKTSKICDERKPNNAMLALEAIEHAKQLAKREQDVARLMRQRFVRFTEQPQLMQQQQEQQQQAMYQLQDIIQKQSRSDQNNNDQCFGDEKMPAVDDLEKINDDEEEDKMPSMLNDNGEEDILDEAAKLAEWL